MVEKTLNMIGVGLSVPDGEYRVIVDDVDDNDDFCTVWFKIIGNKNPDLNERLIMKNFSFTRKALGFFRQFLNFCGIPNEVMESREFVFKSADIIGKELIISYELPDGEKYPIVEVLGKAKTSKQTKM